VRPSARRAVWGLIAAGTVVRLVLAFTTDGQAYDIEALRELRDALEDSGLDVYTVFLGPGDGARWPYPSGFFPFALLAGWTSDAAGLPYTSLVRVPSILADAAIALIVQDFLARRGASERRRIAATALVALGPSFAVVAGYHGQLDSLAFLPAVAALWLWDRVPESRRALYAGLLIGAGASIKTTPVFMLLALLPSVRSWREAGTLAGAAVAVPLALTAPFLLSTPGEVREALGYRGFPGTSGLSILLQPELAEQLTRSVTPNAVVDFLYDRGPVLVAAALVAAAVFSWRTHPEWEPAERATLLWLTFYVVSPVFFFQYLVWGLPFFIMARRLGLALAVQAVALTPTILFYAAPWDSDAVAPPYAVTMIALWALFVAAFVHLARQPRRRAVA
jgi:hypothetical protein